MLYYNRIDLSEGIDVPSNNNKEFIVCNNWYFNHGCEYQNPICNRCQDLTMLYLNLSNIAITIVKVVNYCCIIQGISKSKAIYLLKIMCLMILDIYKMYFKKINFKITSTTILSA